jgi:ketosteroid isomerase-like protein
MLVEGARLEGYLPIGLTLHRVPPKHSHRCNAIRTLPVFYRIVEGAEVEFVALQHSGVRQQLDDLQFADWKSSLLHSIQLARLLGSEVWVELTSRKLKTKLCGNRVLFGRANMKQRLFASLSIVVMMLASSASAEGQTKDKAPSPAAPTDAYFRTLIQQLYDAWSDLDPSKAARFYAKEANLTFFDITPMKYTGWSEYAAGVPKAFAAYQSGKFTVGDDVQIHRHGDLAWGTCTWKADLLKKDGGRENAAGRYTVVWERRGTDWLVVHEHMSSPAPGQ